MSLIMLDGCDDGLAATKWTLAGTWVTVASRTGSGDGYRCSSATGSMRRNLSSAEQHATLTAGFAALLNSAASGSPTDLSRATVAEWRSDAGATLHASINVDPVGRLQVWRGSSWDGTKLGETEPGVAGTGVWHYVEMSVTLSDTAGVVTLRVDGVTLLNLTGVDTKNGGTNTVFDSWNFVRVHSLTPNAYHDDVYLTNGAGAAPHNGMLGDIVVETKYPNGNGYANQWTGSDADSVDNYLLVDEAGTPDGDTTYVVSAADGDIDSYTIADLTATTGDVLGVQATAYARHTGASDNARVFVRIGGTNYAGPDGALASGYSGIPSALWALSPATATAWTIAEVNGAEVGVEDRP